jgi:hypothetical protein
MIYSWAQPFFNALAPFMWYIIGIPVAFIFLRGVMDLFSNIFDDFMIRREEKRIENESFKKDY